MAFGLTPLAAVMVSGYVPALPAAGVPDSRPEADKVTPAGRAPLSENVGAGKPLAVTWKLSNLVTVAVALLALVSEGGWSTVRVNVWVAEPTELVAVIVKA